MLPPVSRALLLASLNRNDALRCVACPSHHHSPFLALGELPFHVAPAVGSRVTFPRVEQRNGTNGLARPASSSIRKRYGRSPHSSAIRTRRCKSECPTHRDDRGP